ncbi:MAG TPA: protein kinase [Ktedonobacteraceae bacterium]|jgi:serine/threonine protein kinase|nr:protein kinase [Ktedonobacteraceae bacterium]
MKGIEGLTLGRYELRRRIAQGGMAEVYLAYDRRVRRQVAIKVLYGRDEAFVRRFEREALAVGTLSHNHILALYDFGEQSPWYYLVMPYVDGGTLRDYLLKRGRLTLEEAASFIDQIASALQYAHEHGMLHRDVKPSNILLRRDGYAYLVDFGLAKAIMGAESLTSSGAMVGTPEYMAPEQSNGQSDYRSDIYSLGVILYQMLTGRVPFTAESPVAISLKHIQATPTPPGELNKDIPPAVEEVILKAMAKDPNDRYQHAQDLANAFWKALQQERTHAQVEAFPSSPSEGTQKAEEEHAPAVKTCVQEATHVGLLDKPRLIPLQTSSDPKEPSKPSFYPAARIRRKKIISAAIALALLIPLILAIPLGLFAWQNSHTHNNRIILDSQTASAQQSWQTATAQAGVQATLAAQSRVQATAGITNSLGAGQVLYADALTTPGGGWIDDGSQCYFTPQGYHVRTYQSREVAWCYSSQQQFTNTVITAQAQLLTGDIYGLVFRLNPTSHTFYVLELNSLGEFRFVRATGYNPLNWLTLIDWTRSSAIQSGYGNLNTFLVIASDSQFRFYINKQLIVTSYTDTAFSSGMIGFLVGGDSAGGTDAVFSNIWVFQR